MKDYKTKLSVVCVAVCLAVFALAGTSQAAGFSLYEWGSKGTALGGNMTGQTDAEVVSFNPAAIAFMDKMKMSVGGQLVSPSGEVKTKDMYSGKSKTKDEDQLYHPLPTLYVAGPIFEKTDFQRFSFGLGVFTRFGLASKFDEDWDGRYNNKEAEVQSYSIQPTFAYRVSKSLAFSLGVDIMNFTLNLKQDIDSTKLFAAQGLLPALAAMGLPTTINDPSTNTMDVGQEISGRSWGFGAVLGVQYQPMDKFGVSLTYRSQVEQNISGTAKFSPSPTVRALMPNNWYTTGVEGTVTLPDSFTLGFMYKPVPKVTLGFTTVYTRWSSYDALKIDYDNPTYGLSSVKSVKDWKDVWRFSLGVGWDVASWVDLYASYVYDQSPIDDDHADYLLPANDRHIFNLGAGFKFANAWRVDINAAYLHITDRDYENHQLETGVLEGSTGNSKTYIVGASVNYTF